MKRFLQIPYYLLIAAVFATGILLLATLVPIPGNFSIKIVKSGSMEPAIKTGGVVVIKPTETYQVGDIITFGKDTKTQIPTTHRIIEIENESFLTKGDANDSPDPLPIQKSDIKGRVIFSAPYVGFVLDFAKKPLGFALIVGIPAMLVIIDEIGKIWREIKRIKKNKNSSSTKRTSNLLDLRIKAGVPSGGRHATHLMLGFMAIVGALIGTFFTGSTVSYYRQSEVSRSNLLQASAFYPNNQIESLVFAIKNEETASLEIATLETIVSEDIEEDEKNEPEKIESDAVEEEEEAGEILAEETKNFDLESEDEIKKPESYTEEDPQVVEVAETETADQDEVQQEEIVEPAVVNM